MTEASFNKKLFTSKLDLKFREATSKLLHSEPIFHGVESWTLWNVHKKYLERCEMWC